MRRVFLKIMLIKILLMGQLWAQFEPIQLSFEVLDSSPGLPSWIRLEKLTLSGPWLEKADPNVSHADPYLEVFQMDSLVFRSEVSQDSDSLLPVSFSLAFSRRQPSLCSPRLGCLQ